MQALEEALLMQQELLDPRADAAAPQAEAVVIEAEVNRFTGVTCTAMVQWGTLRVGDARCQRQAARIMSARRLGFEGVKSVWSGGVEQGQQAPLAVQRHQVVAAANVLLTNENLRHRAAACDVHHLLALTRHQVHPDFIKLSHAT